eukprot:gene10807-12784_t
MSPYSLCEVSQVTSLSLEDLDCEPVTPLDHELAKEFLAREPVAPVFDPRKRGMDTTPQMQLEAQIYSSRPSTAASSREASREGSRGAGGEAVPDRLFGCDFLNNHPILLEYMANDTATSSRGQEELPAAQPSSRKGSFVHKLRLTTADMNATSSMTPAKLADLNVASSLPSVSNDMDAAPANNPQQVIRKLLKVIEQLKQERDMAVEAEKRAMAALEQAPSVRSSVSFQPATASENGAGDSTTTSTTTETPVPITRREAEEVAKTAEMLVRENKQAMGSEFDEGEDALFAQLGVTARETAEVEKDVIAEASGYPGVAAQSSTLSEAVKEVGRIEQSVATVQHELEAVQAALDSLVSPTDEGAPSFDLDIRKAVGEERMAGLQAKLAGLEQDLENAQFEVAAAEASQRLNESQTPEPRREQAAAPLLEDDAFNDGLSMLGGSSVETERDRLIRTGMMTPFANLSGFERQVQVAAFLGGLHYSNKFTNALVLCPATMLRQYPQFQVVILHDSAVSEDSAASAGSRSGALRASLDNVLASSAGIAITTYEGFRTRQDMLLPVRWGYAILDEGHKIRNPDADVTLACKQLRTIHRIILTGAPIQNRLTELWSLFDFVFPGKLGTLPVFQANFSIPIQVGGYANASQLQVSTAYRCAVVLKDMVTPYLLRRLKADVNANLPKKTEQVLFCPLTREQRELYRSYIHSEDVEAILDGQRDVLAGIDILKKICNHPDLLERLQGAHMDDYGNVERSGKMLATSRVLDHWQQQGHRVLLFSQTKQMLDILEKLVCSKRARDRTPSPDFLESDAAMEQAADDVVFDGDFHIQAEMYKRLFAYQQTGVKWLWELHCQNTGNSSGELSTDDDFQPDRSDWEEDEEELVESSARTGDLEQQQMDASVARAKEATRTLLENRGRTVPNVREFSTPSLFASKKFMKDGGEAAAKNKMQEMRKKAKAKEAVERDEQAQDDLVETLDRHKQAWGARHDVRSAAEVSAARSSRQKASGPGGGASEAAGRPSDAAGCYVCKSETWGPQNLPAKQCARCGLRWHDICAQP